MAENQTEKKKPLRVYEWCLGYLKGKNGTLRVQELWNTYSRHFGDWVVPSEENFEFALQLFPQYFILEDFNYDYVTLQEDGSTGSPVVELAKGVLRNHQNRYTLSVLLQRIKDEGGDVCANLDEASLKTLLSPLPCFTIEQRSFKNCRLTEEGWKSEVEAISYRRPTPNPSR